MRKPWMEWVIQRACLGKANLNEEECNLIIDKLLAEDGLMLYYYHCQFCGSYHLTSSEPDKVKFNIEYI